MATFEQRTDRYAADLYSLVNGPFVTTHQLCEYLRCSKRTAKEILAPIVPAVKTKYPRYYYIDVAEELAKEA